MRVWIVNVYEPLPGLDPGRRPQRFGLLADHLVDRGHDVTMWSSEFEHFSRRHRFRETRTVEIRPGYRAVLMRALTGYKRTVSLRRVIHNRSVARRFRALAEGEATRPDIILTVVPCLELAEVAVDYGRRHGVPVVVDAMDPWPDQYLRAVPAPARGVARRLLGSEFRRAERIFGGATGVSAHSDTYVRWAAGYAGRTPGDSDIMIPLGSTPSAAADEWLAARARELREGWGIGERDFVAIYLGQFGDSYDLDTVLDAAEALERAGESSIRFILAGDGNQAARLRKRAAPLANVTLPGWVDWDSAVALMRSASVGLAAYRAEAHQTLPFKPFDYMSAGLPIVSCLRGELEVLLARERVGTSYPAGDGAGLARVLTRLAASPAELAAMRSRAGRVFRERFDNAAIYSRFAEYLERTAGVTPAGAAARARLFSTI